MWNLLQEGTKISHFRDRHSSLAAFYHMENDICFCTDVDGLMNELGYKHEVNEETVHRLRQDQLESSSVTQW